MSAPLAPGLSAPSETFEHWWSHLSGWAKAVSIFVGLALVIQIASSFVAGVTGSGSTPSGSGSSLSTESDGVAAMAQLFGARGYSVSRLTTSISSLSSPRGVVFILDPTNFTSRDARSVASLVRGGTTVVVSGQGAAVSALDALIGASPYRWSGASTGAARATSSARFVRGVTTVYSPDAGSLVGSSQATTQAPAIVANGSSVLAVVARGGGWLVALATSSALQNANLASADNAAFALNLAASRSRTVIFDEYAHGIGTSGTGLSALPDSWRWGLGAMLLAVAIWILSAATRFGPVQRRQRELIPPRVLYVDAMAGLLDARGTSDRAQAVEPVRRELHDTLTRRLGARGDADAATLTELAERQWGANDERVTFAAALDRDVLDDEEIVRVGTALARLRRETMRGAR